MSIKYCYNGEIHKTLNIPPDYSCLIKDFTSLFVQKLPSQFILQYQDPDGDKIAITNNLEYQTLIKHELSTSLSCVKLLITSITPTHISEGRRSTCTPRTDSNGSFEVVENENSLRMEELVDIAPSDHEGEDELGSKIVVSLQIPSGNISRHEEKVTEDCAVKEEEDPSFSCSATGKSRTSESRDLVQEMSLSMVEERSAGDGESCASRASFNQAFQTEEENLSVSEESPREREVQETVVEKRRMITLEIPDFKEKDSRDLSEYLSRIIKRRSIDQLSPKLVKVLSSNTSEAAEDDKSKEESPERWVSFSSQHDETPTRQDVELQGRSLFTLRQRPEAWFMCNQDRSNRYRESEGSEGEGLACKGQLPEKRSPGKSNENFRMFNDEDVEERRGMYRELKQNGLGTEQPSVEISFKENANDLLHDIWYDLQHSPQLQSDKAQQVSFDDYRELKTPAEEEQETLREVVETMNISLLTASEAKRIASAIGSIHRIDGVKKLKIFPEPNTPTVQAKPTSPVYNKWACKRSDIKLPDEEDWPFLKQCEAACKKDTCNLADNKVHEGSFCMGCWQSPIKGSRFVCLICDDIEYCEACEVRINHCHPLLKIKEAIGSLQDFMENLRGKFVQKSEPVFTPRGELSFKEESVYKDIENLERSLEGPFELETYHSNEKTIEEYKFDFKEISSTPLIIRSNKKEWCVVYKTICLKNTGNSVWRRCHFEPVGLVPGTITEVTYVSPGDTVLITLEIHGFFAPGKYNSTWRVVHQGELNLLNEMGYIDLEFEVVENKTNFFNGPSCDREIEEDEFHDYY